MNNIKSEQTNETTDAPSLQRDSSLVFFYIGRLGSSQISHRRTRLGRARSLYWWQRIPAADPTFDNVIKHICKKLWARQTRNQARGVQTI